VRSTIYGLNEKKDDLEIAGGIGSIIPAFHYIEVWDDLIEWPKEDAVNVLTKCCRSVSGPVKSE